MDQLNSKYNINKTISTHAKELLAEHNWPGNIRELQYVLENLFVTSSTNQITTDELPTIYTKRPVVDSTQQKETLNFTNEVENFERNLLLRVFTEQKSSYKVAKMLGISQSKASRLLRKYQIH
jgi:transcriptional regulator with PAS, ATPase and Fis domain